MNNFDTRLLKTSKNKVITVKNVKSNWEYILTNYQVFTFCSTFVEQETEQET